MVGNSATALVQVSHNYSQLVISEERGGRERERERERERKERQRGKALNSVGGEAHTESAGTTVPYGVP